MQLLRNTIENSEACIGIIAGTQIDTRFGLDFLQSRNIIGIGLPISVSPQEQTKLQALGRVELTQHVLVTVKKLVESGASSCMIYCNSLSGAIDIDKIKLKSDIKIITPLDVYAELTKKYRNFGLLAANCQSCSNVERIILAENPTAKVIGIGNLQIVEDIEARLPPKTIINLHALTELTDALVKSGVQIFIMGCTHFDYFFDELNVITKGIKLYQPSERMLELLQTNQ